MFDAYRVQFLCRRAGAGYQLVLETTETVKVLSLTNLVLSHVPTATPNTGDYNRLRYNLPESSAASFKYLLAAIEKDKKKLGIIKYDMVAMSLEDVFIR